MPTPRKTVSRILLDGNTSHLTKAQIAQRVAAEVVEEPTVSAGTPKMPGTKKNPVLSPLEQECWKGAAKIMRSRGTLTKGDAENLELFAVTKARWVLARRDVEKRGLSIIETRHAKDGTEYEVEVANPSLKICDSCEQRLLAYSKVLGLSAIDRTKVKATKGSKSQEKFVAKPGTAAALMPELFDAKGKVRPIC